jgi:hypothetical protein
VKKALGILAVCVLVLGGLLAWQLWPTSTRSVDSRASTARACETAVRVYKHMEGLATNARGGQYTYPARYQVLKVVDAFHADGVPAALVRQADKLDRTSAEGAGVDTDVQLDLLVTACQ